MLGKQVAFDEPLAKHTSLRVGGPADALARIDDRDRLERVLEVCREYQLDPLVLGGGFNTLVRDSGYRGLVLRLQGLRQIEYRDGVLHAGAGTSHSSISRFCADQALTGLEFAASIPGTVGGWIAMNAGTREREMADVVARIEVVDPETGGVEVREREALSFSYRRTELPRSEIVAAASFEIEPGDAEVIQQITRELLESRRETQPVDQRSCGSVFKNPSGDSSGRLIEAAGLKGARHGGAQISTIHANFIVNRGDATASDVLALLERAREEVAGQFGIELEPEVCIIGEEA
ncbi:MAG: UDP-N-acetylmuramate dehydrogenase [bacterium]|nr:UDP-N-acetylmuramate dehydrogenase [bacterium]